MTEGIPLRATKSHIDLLRRLSEAVGVSGDEAAVRRIICQELEPFVSDLHLDPLGNILILRRGTGRRRLRVLVAAHMDEVGLMLTHVDPDGLFGFEPVGEIDLRALLGKPVWIGDERTPGIIGVRPAGLLPEAERATLPPLDALRIDVGASSPEVALEHVRPGTRAAFAMPFLHLGPTVRGKALDNRLGVAGLIELVRHPPSGVDLLAAFTVQEEVHRRGARAAAFGLDPDIGIALDTTPARDLPAWDGGENPDFNTRLGAGPALCPAGRRTLSHARLLRHFETAAQAEGIPCQIRQPGHGGTDAESIHLTRAGVASLSISVPGRYLHGPAAIASLEDWRGAVRLIHAGVSSLRPSVLGRA